MIYLLVGSPGIGKTWISNQLKHKFEVMEHDNYKDIDLYIHEIRRLSKISSKPILANTPFGVSALMQHLDCIPLFAIERSEILKNRYLKREGKPIPQGHLTRQHTYLQRAKDLDAFVGTTEQVLEYLIGL